MADVEAQQPQLDLSNTTVAQPQAISTNGPPPVSAPPSPLAGNPDPQRAEKYGDPSDGVWSMYLTEAEKQDKDVIESWRGDTEGILVFTGLFSATVAAFIIESYQNLSPDPGDTTNALLTQISQQLVDISNGTPLTSVTVQSGQPFKPAASAVRVNVLWFFSLVLSLSCALSATLMQQWARRYKELAQHHGPPHRRGRIRAYIFDGISRFGMARAVATMPMLLHISVFLFFAGLIDFLFPVDTTVSYPILGLVGAFVLAYAILTVLPNLYLNCPYATPLSGFAWRFSQLSVVVGLKAALGIEDLFHNSLLKLWSRVNRHVTGPGIERWRDALKKQVEVHRQWLSDGLRKSIERSAKDAPSTVVASALEWTLTGLDEDKEIETFAAGIPGFFDSRAVLDATSTILPLLSEKAPTVAILGLRSRLYDLLKTCMPGTSPLNNEERQSRLRVCLKCLCYFGRAYNQSGASEPLPSYFPLTLASPEIIRCIQTERDPVIRVMGRCFGALVVTKLAADVKSSTNSSIQISEEQLACLSAILGESCDVRLWLTRPSAVQVANMVSLALDDFASLFVNAVPSDVLDVAQQTLAILSHGLPAEATADQRLDQPIAQVDTPDEKLARTIHDLLQICISGSPRLTDEVRRSCLRMCLKSLWYYAKVFHQLGVALPSYFPHALATPEITRYIQQEGDRTSRLIGYCFEALVVTKLAANLNSGTVRVGDEELACLSAILGAEIHDVEVWLRLPGAIEHMGLFFLAFGEVGSIKASCLDDIEQSDVLDIVQQTFSILSQTLPAEPWPDRTAALVHDHRGEFTPGPILQYRLEAILKTCTTRTSPLTNEARMMCLTSMWYYGIACHHVRASRSSPVWDFFTIHFTAPKIFRRVHTGEDLASRVIGRCFESLVVNKLAADFTSGGDSELASLSAILGTANREVQWLSQPGAVQFVNLVSLIFNDVGSFVTDTVPSNVLHILVQTISILARSLPAELKAELQLVRADSPNSSIRSILVSHLHALLKACTLRTLPLSEEVRTSCLQTCLNGLWHWGKVLHQLGASQPLPTELLDLAGPDITRYIRNEKDQASRVMGRCVEALVVNNIVARVKSRTGSTAQISDGALKCLSAILGTENRDVMLWLSQPGAIELVNIVFLAFDENENGSLDADTVPSYVLDVVPQTFSILSRAFPTAIITELGLDEIHAPTDIPDGTAPMLSEIYQNHSMRCLKNLWRCIRAYNQSGNSVRLPPYLLTAFATPAISRRLRTERDVAARVIGRCFGSLVGNRLTAEFKLSGDRERAFLSAILGDGDRKAMGWLSKPGAFQFVNLVSLIFGEVGPFVTNTVPSDVLHIVGQTITVLAQALPDELKSSLRVIQADSLMNFPNRSMKSIIVHILNLLCQTTRGFFLPEEVRNSCLQTCLNGLWCWGKVLHQLDASQPLPPQFLNLAGPDITRYIRTEKDQASRVMGLCVEALVVNNLVARIKSRTDSTVQISDEALKCLSAILGTESRNVMLWLSQPGAIELVNVIFLAFGDIGSLDADTVPSYVLDVVAQTFSILSQAFPAEITTELGLDEANAPADIPDVTGPILYQSYSIRWLKNLWRCVRAYNRPGNSVPLPSYVLIGFASPAMTRRIRTEQDVAARVIGHCFESLVVNKLVADFNLGGDGELACLSAILDTTNREVMNWLNQPGAVQFVNLVSLIFSEVGPFVTNAVPSDVLHMVGQTLSILAQALPDELKSSLRVIQADSLMNFPNCSMESIIAPLLNCLLNAPKFLPLSLPEEVRTSCLKTCLNGLWRWGKALHQFGASQPLPPQFLDLAGPEITRHIRTEKDQASRVMGRCVEGLVVTNLVARVKSRTDSTVQSNDEALKCLSTILGTGSHDVMLWLSQPGAIELVNLIFLAFGAIGSLAADTVPSYVLDVVAQTFSIVSRAFPDDIYYELELYQIHAPTDNPDGTAPILSQIHQDLSIRCLKSLWNCVHNEAYNLSAGSVPSYLLTAFSSPAITRLIRTERDVVARVMGRCVEALVIKKLVAGVKSSTDSNNRIRHEDLACLSAILCTENHDVESCLEWPGAVDLANTVSLALGDVGSLAVNALPSDVLDVVQQTLAMLSQDLPAEDRANLQIDQFPNYYSGRPISRLDISDGEFESIIVSRLRDLLQMCISGTSPPTAQVRRSCLRMCLNSLWYCAKVYHQLVVSKLLPSYFFLDLLTPEIIRHIPTEKDPVSHAIGRCFGALLINNVVANVKSRTNIVPVQISYNVMACLPAILGTEGRDLKIWRDPDTVELANMLSFILSTIDSLFTDAGQSDVLDMIQQTFSILSRTLPANLNAELTNFTDGTSPLAESIHSSRLRTSLKNLWHCARAYSKLEISVPLPSFVSNTLAGSEITRRIHAHEDIAARVIGRCVEALVVNKLVDDFQSPNSFSSGAEELACISSILVTEPSEFLRWPRPSSIIKLQNVVFLVSGEIEALFLSGGTTPADVLHIAQQTLNTICPELVPDGGFAGADLPVDQVSLLREICSKIVNAQPANRFRDQTVEILNQLQQISEQLPSVEHMKMRKMRRCTSSIFYPPFIRGRSTLPTRPDGDVRRRRTKSI